MTDRFGANRRDLRKENRAQMPAVNSTSNPAAIHSGGNCPQRLGGASGLLGPPRIRHWPPARPSKRPLPGSARATSSQGHLSGVSFAMARRCPCSRKGVSDLPARSWFWLEGICSFFLFFSCSFFALQRRCVMEPTKQHRNAGTSTRAGSPPACFGGLGPRARCQSRRQSRRAGGLIIAAICCH